MKTNKQSDYRAGMRIVDSNGEIKISGSSYFVSSSAIGQRLQIFRDGQGYYAMSGVGKRPYRLRQVKDNGR